MDRMIELEKLIKLVFQRKNFYIFDLFESYLKRDARLEELTNEINELAASLSIFNIHSYSYDYKDLTCQFLSLEALQAFGQELIEDKGDDDIHTYCFVEVDSKKVKLLHVELIEEEHKKTQAI